LGEPLDALFNVDNITEQNCMNTAFYSNESVQQLFRLAAVDWDVKRQIHRYQQIEHLIIQDASCILLCQLNFESIRQPWLKGVVTRGHWPTVGLEATWIDK